MWQVRISSVTATHYFFFEDFFLSVFFASFFASPFPPLPASFLLSFFEVSYCFPWTFTTFPSITTPFPSKKAIRARPSHDLNGSATNPKTGSKTTSAISPCLSILGSSTFLPPVSFPIFQLIFFSLHALRPQRTKPMGEYPGLSSCGTSKTCTCAVNSPVAVSDLSELRIITSPARGGLSLWNPFTFMPTLSPGIASGTLLWCISMENTFPVHGLFGVWVGRNVTSASFFRMPCSTLPASTSPTPLMR
mmetsp:Transcript_29236/g.40766  ORF Transcript_29236/g.40766 Transcript_29236/m.40766 type:complete len:248 (-) Transcript_29236:125-868(-)